MNNSVVCHHLAFAPCGDSFPVVIEMDLYRERTILGKVLSIWLNIPFLNEPEITLNQYHMGPQNDASLKNSWQITNYVHFSGKMPFTTLKTSFRRKNPWNVPVF